MVHWYERMVGALLVASIVVIGCQSDRGGPEAVDHADAPDPPAEAPAAGENRLRTVYVPAYSHLPSFADGDPRKMMSILLSVRNIDTSSTVTLTHVDYYDTEGNRVRRYLGKSRKLRPLETVEFSVGTTDDVGGSGANFLVYWEGPTDAHPLLTEVVMVGHLGAGYVGFTSRGVELDRRPAPGVLNPAPGEPVPATTTTTPR